MAGAYSPYGSTPAQEYIYDEKKFPSPSPTPSPRGPSYYYGATPQRPATRAHFRNGSTSGINNSNTGYASPRGPSFSPRYTSDGQYATVNVSVSRPRKPSFSGPPRPSRERRSSFSYHPASVSHGESDEDEFIDLGGQTFVLPGRSRPRPYKDHFTVNAGGHGTDYGYYAQGGPIFDREAGFASARFEPDRRPPPPAGHSRRSSTSMPQRPQTARPSASMHKKQRPRSPRLARPLPKMPSGTGFPLGTR